MMATPPNLQDLDLMASQPVQEIVMITMHPEYGCRRRWRPVCIDDRNDFDGTLTPADIDGDGYSTCAETARQRSILTRRQ